MGLSVNPKKRHRFRIQRYAASSSIESYLKGTIVDNKAQLTQGWTAVQSILRCDLMRLIVRQHLDKAEPAAWHLRHATFYCVNA
jgi:hypothetical protein